MALRWPTPAEAAATVSLLGALGSYFGLALPEQQRADANRAANFEARDLLREERLERQAVQARLEECLSR